MLGSVFTVVPGTTVYVGIGIGDTWEGVSAPVGAGQFKELRFGTKEAPGMGQSFRYTLMVNGEATDLDFTVSDLASVGHKLADVEVDDDDRVCVRVIASAGATRVGHNGSYIWKRLAAPVTP